MFKGADYDPYYDKERLEKQLGRVWDCMKDGRWRTLREIEHITKDPQSSISAQLRNLRKPEFGGYQVNRRPCQKCPKGSGAREYQLIIPAQHPEKQMELSV